MLVEGTSIVTDRHAKGAQVSPVGTDQSVYQSNQFDAMILGNHIKHSSQGTNLMDMDDR